MARIANIAKRKLTMQESSTYASTRNIMRAFLAFVTPCKTYQDGDHFNIHLTLEAMDSKKGEAAGAVIRRCFTQLTDVLTTAGLIPDHLYQENLIDRETFEHFTNDSLTDTQKGRKMLLDVQKKVTVCPSLFTKFCEILSGEETTKEWAQLLEGMLPQLSDCMMYSCM